MWTLESSGDSLGGHIKWLRPGKTFTFGRHKGEGATDVIQVADKSVSRKHLTLCIAPNPSGRGALPHNKSGITVTDEATKFRSEVDGLVLSKESRLLPDSEKHYIKLGNSKQIFTLRWRPVVLSFMLSSKEKKAGNDPLTRYRERLETLDVKLSEAYVINATTHVVAPKRNTNKGLQALINGRYIVSELFLDALLKATSVSTSDPNEHSCPLEQDLIKNWPNELDYLPPRSKEPSDRPDSDFRPLPDRANVFEGYTFVFCNKLQFDTLHSPIANGAGKAVLCPVEIGKTTTLEIVQFVKNVAGEKGLGTFEDGSEGKGVVVVRFRAEGEHAAWAARLDHDIAQALDHRLIEQNEFLDAILANNASGLRRPLLSENAQDPRAPQKSLDASNDLERPALSQKAVRAKRGPIVRRFKGFEDDEEEDKYHDKNDDGAISQGATAIQRIPATELDSETVHMSQVKSLYKDDKDREEGDHGSVTATSTSRRKRKASPQSADPEELMDDLLPGTAVMKRRRLEMENEARESPHSVVDGSLPEGEQTDGIQGPEKHAQKSMNVKSAMSERRRAEDEAARRNEEDLHQELPEMTVEQMKNLAVVETMPMPRRANGPTVDAQAPSRTGDPRWKECWNGRKNFKKFRRRGAPTERLNRETDMIVPLVQYRKNGRYPEQNSWMEQEDASASSGRLLITDTRRESETAAPDDSDLAMANDEVSGNTSSGLRHLANGQSSIRDTMNSYRSRDPTASADSQIRPKAASGSIDPVRSTRVKKRKHFAVARDSDQSDSN